MIKAIKAFYTNASKGEKLGRVFILAFGAFIIVTTVISIVRAVIGV